MIGNICADNWIDIFKWLEIWDLKAISRAYAGFNHLIISMLGCRIVFCNNRKTYYKVTSGMSVIKTPCINKYILEGCFITHVLSGNKRRVYDRCISLYNTSLCDIRDILYSSDTSVWTDHDNLIVEYKSKSYVDRIQNIACWDPKKYRVYTRNNIYYDGPVKYMGHGNDNFTKYAIDRKNKFIRIGSTNMFIRSYTVIFE